MQLATAQLLASKPFPVWVFLTVFGQCLALCASGQRGIAEEKRKKPVNRMEKRGPANRFLEDMRSSFQRRTPNSLSPAEPTLKNLQRLSSMAKSWKSKRDKNIVLHLADAYGQWAISIFAYRSQWGVITLLPERSSLSEMQSAYSRMSSTLLDAFAFHSYSSMHSFASGYVRADPGREVWSICGLSFHVFKCLNGYHIQNGWSITSLNLKVLILLRFCKLD